MNKVKMTIPSVDRDMEHLELLNTLVRTQNGIATLEKRETSYKVKH